MICKYTSTKRKAKENVGLRLNGAGALGTMEEEKAKVLSAFFTLAFTDKNSLQGATE